MSALPSVALAALAALAPQRELVRTSTIQLGEGERVLDALLVDVDGRGRTDLVLARDHGGGRRTLDVHTRGAGERFDPAPRWSLELTPDVVAFAVADVHADPGREPLLFNARGAFVWRPGAPREERLARLFELELLWQLPAEGALFAWQEAVVDLDGDGLEDLVLPEPSGWRVAFQRRAGEARAFEPTLRLAAPETPSAEPFAEQDLEGGRASASASRGGRRVSIAFDDEGLSLAALGGPLLEVSESVPAVRALDFDGDGDLDLLALGRAVLWVWLQEPRGSFGAAPSLTLPSPVERDLGRLVDVSFGAHALELDGDGRADCVFLARDERADDLRTQVLVYVRGDEEPPLFGPEGLPRQVLVVAGLVASARFVDVDGDGALDLVLVVVRPDLIDAVRAARTERLDAQVYVYRNLGGRFSPRPDLAHAVSLGADVGEHALRFVGDLSGDGLCELLVRDAGGRLAFLLLRRGRSGLEVVDKPLVELALPQGAEGRYPRGARADELVWVAEREVLWLGWR